MPVAGTAVTSGFSKRRKHSEYRWLRMVISSVQLCSSYLGFAIVEDSFIAVYSELTVFSELPDFKMKLQLLICHR